MSDLKAAGAGATPSAARRILRWLPLLILAAGLAGSFALGLDRYFDFELLQANRHRLAGLVAEHHALAVVGYIAAYAAVVAFSLPGAALMTMLGGFLFGLAPGTACAVIGATLGAIAIFLAARSALGDILRAKAGPALKRMEAGFSGNAFTYLLVLRLVPLFPFWLVNLVPAMLGMKLGSFALATLIGIVPGGLVYASLGVGLDAVLAAGERPDLGIVMRAEVLGPLIGLAALALVPVVYKRMRARRAAP